MIYIYKSIKDLKYLNKYRLENDMDEYLVINCLTQLKFSNTFTKMIGKPAKELPEYFELIGTYKDYSTMLDEIRYDFSEEFI